MKKTLRSELASGNFAQLERTNPQDELEVIRGFFRRLDLTPSIEHRDKPDFAIIANATIACEVTRYYADAGERGSPERRAFKRWIDFAKRLREALRESNLDHIHGSVFFAHKPKGLRDLIPEIKTLLTEHHAVGRVDNFDVQRFPKISCHVEHFWLVDTTPERGVLWWESSLQTGAVPDPLPGLRRCVREKDDAASQYDWPRARERWLVIHAAAHGINDIAVLADTPPRVNSSAFDRVFLWDRFCDVIHELAYNPCRVYEAGNVYIKRLPVFLYDDEE